MTEIIKIKSNFKFMPSEGLILKFLAAELTESLEFLVNNQINYGQAPLLLPLKAFYIYKTHPSSNRNAKENKCGNIFKIVSTT